MVKTSEYKLLIVEDDPSQQNLMEMIFKYSIKDEKLVDQSYNLNDAINKIQKNNYNLIICDLRLPNSNSIEETVNKIISIKGDSKVIFVTVEDIDKNLLDKINSNECKFVSKNLNFLNEIQTEINQHIR